MSVNVIPIKTDEAVQAARNVPPICAAKAGHPSVPLLPLVYGYQTDVMDIFALLMAGHYLEPEFARNEAN